MGEHWLGGKKTGAGFTSVSSRGRRRSSRLALSLSTEYVLERQPRQGRYVRAGGLRLMNRRATCRAHFTPRPPFGNRSQEGAPGMQARTSLLQRSAVFHTGNRLVRATLVSSTEQQSPETRTKEPRR